MIHNRTFIFTQTAQNSKLLWIQLSSASSLRLLPCSRCAWLEIYPHIRYTSYIFEILYMTNAVTQRMYSHEAVAPTIIGMHLSFTQHDTSSTISSRSSGNISLAAGTTPEVAMGRFLTAVSFEFDPAGFQTTNAFHEYLVITRYLPIKGAMWP